MTKLSKLSDKEQLLDKIVDLELTIEELKEEVKSVRGKSVCFGKNTEFELLKDIDRAVKEYRKVCDENTKLRHGFYNTLLERYNEHRLFGFCWYTKK